MKSSNEDKLFCSLLTIICKAFQEIFKKIGGKARTADDIKADSRKLPLVDRVVCGSLIYNKVLYTSMLNLGEK
jgi:hypothetical protein